jgi:PadR family transcriptional regulator, regulatory protein PadR
MCSGPCQGHQNQGHHHQLVEGCCAGGGRVRGFLQARLLLLLEQQPDYGYALLERLSSESSTGGVDPGLLYRTLRQMERDGLVSSTWDTEGQGPARRRYEVTAEGIEMLHAWAARIAQTQRRLNEFLDQYAKSREDRKQEEAV